MQLCIYYKRQMHVYLMLPSFCEFQHLTMKFWFCSSCFCNLLNIAHFQFFSPSQKTEFAKIITKFQNLNYSSRYQIFNDISVMIAIKMLHFYPWVNCIFLEKSQEIQIYFPVFKLQESIYLRKQKIVSRLEHKFHWCITKKSIIAKTKSFLHKFTQMTSFLWAPKFKAKSWKNEIFLANKVI